jgi:hypothetical protein
VCCARRCGHVTQRVRQIGDIVAPGDWEGSGDSAVLINDPSHWRERAQQARATAEQIPDPEARRMMQEIADGYERLARRAEERLATAPQ